MDGDDVNDVAVSRRYSFKGRRRAAARDGNAGAQEDSSAAATTRPGSARYGDAGAPMDPARGAGRPAASSYTQEQSSAPAHARAPEPPSFAMPPAPSYEPPSYEQPSPPPPARAAAAPRSAFVDTSHQRPGGYAQPTFVDTSAAAAAPPPAMASPPPKRATPYASPSRAMMPPPPQRAPASAGVPAAAMSPQQAAGGSGEEELDVGIAQQAAMEKFGQTGLVVEFTDDQARQLEEAALLKALRESEEAEAAMWGLRVENDGRVAVDPAGASTAMPPPRVPEQPLPALPPLSVMRSVPSADSLGGARGGAAGVGSAAGAVGASSSGYGAMPPPPEPAYRPTFVRDASGVSGVSGISSGGRSGSGVSHLDNLEGDHESVDPGRPGIEARTPTKRFGLGRIKSKLRGSGKSKRMGGSGGIGGDGDTDSVAGSVSASDHAGALGAAESGGDAPGYYAGAAGGDTPAAPLDFSTLTGGAEPPPPLAYPPPMPAARSGSLGRPGSAASGDGGTAYRSAFEAPSYDAPRPIAAPPAYLRSNSNASAVSGMSSHRGTASGGGGFLDTSTGVVGIPPPSPAARAISLNRDPAAFAAAAGGAGAAAGAAAGGPGNGQPANEEDELARVMRESELEAQRAREQEEAEFEEQLRRVMADSQAARQPAGSRPPRPALTGSRPSSAGPGAGAAAGERWEGQQPEEESEEELLRRVMEQSQAEEEARRKREEEEEEEMLRRILEESARDSGGAYVSSGPPSARGATAAAAAERDLQAAVAASREAGTDECVRETRQLREDFEQSLEQLQHGLDEADSLRSALERELASAREADDPRAGALASQFSAACKELNEMERRLAPLQHAVAELQSLEEFVSTVKPPKAEFVVLKDAIMVQLSEELTSVGWEGGSGAEEGPGGSNADAGAEQRYGRIAQQVSEQTRGIVQSSPRSIPAGGAAAAQRPRSATPAGAATPAAAGVAVGAGVAAAAAARRPATATGAGDATPAGAAAGADACASGAGARAASAAAATNLDLNATLSGLRDMRQRIEERRQRRADSAKKLDGTPRVGGGSAAGARNESRSTYLAALENLKSSILSVRKDGPQRGAGAAAAGVGAAAVAGVAVASSTSMAPDEDGSSSDEDAPRVAVQKKGRSANAPGFFNPEEVIAQKREWVESILKNDIKEVCLPSQCFEHLVIVGLPPTIDEKYLVSTAQPMRKGRHESDDGVRGPKGPALPAEVLYSYPPDKQLENADSIADFCFPHGVQPVLCERTPSLSSLNEVIYGQHFHDRDDHSFVFVLKVADNLPQYGVCCYMEEFVTIPPSLAGDKYGSSRAPRLGRTVVAAPRCYCLLSHYPFFSLHFQVLDMMLGLGRLERITHLVADLSQPNEDDGGGPIDDLSARLAAIGGDNDTTASSTGFSGRAGGTANGRGSEHESYDNGGADADRQRSGSLATPSYGSGRSDQFTSIHVASAMQVLQHYYQSGVPGPGQGVELRPEPTLKAIAYRREQLVNVLAPPGATRITIATAEAEAANSLRHWTVAALCRCLSVDNVLTLLTAVMLERQVMVFCPNIGLLSAVVLSLLPMLRPFTWQSLMLPILPASMLGFVEAPVPFVLGMVYKTPEVRQRCQGLVRVNAYKNRVKNAKDLPALPGHAELRARLQKPHAELAAAAKEPHVEHSPVYVTTEAQRQASDTFLEALHSHLSGLFANLRAHTITSVQTTDRVSMLLKESFVESFGTKDRPFIKQFVETQMFSVYCDAVLQ